MYSADELIERKGVLAGARGNFDSLWQEGAELVHPQGGDYNTKRSPGDKRTTKVYEMTAANALETFAAAMESFLTPRTQRWHHLRASTEELNEVQAVREFFDEAERVLFKLRNSPSARFYGQIHEVYKGLGLTGNGCLYVDEVPAGGIRYRYTHVGQTWMETNFEGTVDTVFYEYELTAKAALQKWGELAPASAKSAATSDPNRKQKYLHAVLPNSDRDRERKDAKGKAFLAYEISLEDQAFVGEPGGYDEFPYMWTRYTVNPAEMYGRGPVGLVLPDIQTLQEMQKTFLRAGHKVVDPPLLAASGGKLGRGSKQIRLAPGGLNFGGLTAQGQELIKPLHTGARLDMNHEMMERLRQNIDNALLKNLFDLMQRERTQMTATEVLERAKEKGQLLTPVIGRQQAELLGPLIEREIGIAQRQGMLPPLPQELVEAQGEFEIEYESDATRMQKSDEVAAFVRWQEVMAGFIENDPTLLDKVNAEAAAEHYAHDLGVPSKLIRSKDEMREIHDQRAQEAEQAQAAETLPAQASALKDVSQMVAA